MPSVGGEGPTKRELVDANCWFAVDRVGRDPATTAWKQSARLRQARWRERHADWKVGAHPYRGGEKASVVGSRLELAFAMNSGANFITPGALAAARHRVATPQKHQMLNVERLYADLLSSMPLCFNLFGDLSQDRAAARANLQAWWPELPHGEVHVGFEYSPGRLDPAYLGNRSAFDGYFEVTAESGARSIVGVETKYHEHAAVEPAPSERALGRYVEVTERSRAFLPDWQTRIVGTDLQQIWLDHLLLLSMLQHPAQAHAHGLFVLVYPAGNASFASAAQRYREALADPTTFQARTLEELVETPGGLPPETRDAFRARYL